MNYEQQQQQHAINMMRMNQHQRLMAQAAPNVQHQQNLQQMHPSMSAAINHQQQMRQFSGGPQTGMPSQMMPGAGQQMRMATDFHHYTPSPEQQQQQQSQIQQQQQNGISARSKWEQQLKNIVAQLPAEHQHTINLEKDFHKRNLLAEATIRRYQFEQQQQHQQQQQQLAAQQQAQTSCNAMTRVLSSHPQGFSQPIVTMAGQQHMQLMQQAGQTSSRALSPYLAVTSTNSGGSVSHPQQSRQPQNSVASTSAGGSSNSNTGTSKSRRSISKRKTTANQGKNQAQTQNAQQQQQIQQQSSNSAFALSAMAQQQQQHQQQMLMLQQQQLQQHQQHQQQQHQLMMSMAAAHHSPAGIAATTAAAQQQQIYQTATANQTGTVSAAMSPAISIVTSTALQQQQQQIAPQQITLMSQQSQQSQSHSQGASPAGVGSQQRPLSNASGIFVNSPQLNASTPAAPGSASGGVLSNQPSTPIASSTPIPQHNPNSNRSVPSVGPPNSVPTPGSVPQNSQQPTSETESPEYQELFDKLKSFKEPCKQLITRLELDCDNSNSKKLHGHIVRLLEVIDGHRSAKKELLIKLLTNVITVINQQNPVNSLLKLTKYVGRLGGEVDSADCSLDLSLSTESQPEMEKLLPDPWQTIRHMEISQKQLESDDAEDEEEDRSPRQSNENGFNLASDNEEQDIKDIKLIRKRTHESDSDSKTNSPADGEEAEFPLIKHEKMDDEHELDAEKEQSLALVLFNPMETVQTSPQAQEIDLQTTDVEVTDFQAQESVNQTVQTVSDSDAVNAVDRSSQDSNETVEEGSAEAESKYADELEEEDASLNSQQAMLLEGTGDDEDQYQSSPSSASNGNEDQVNNNRINSNVAPYHYQEVPNQKISLSCFTDKQVCQLSDNLSIALQKHCFCYSSPPIQQLTMFGDNGVDCSSEKPFMFRLDDDDAPLSGTSRVVRAAFDLAFTNGCLSRLKMGRAPTLHLLLPLSYPHEAVQIAANEQDRQQRTMLDDGDEDKANKLADLGPLAEQRLRQRIDQGAVNRHDIGAILDAWKECLYESAELMNAYEYNDDDDDDYPVDEAYEFGEEEEGMDDYDIVDNVDNDDVDEDEERDEEEAADYDIDIIMDSPY